MNTFTTNLKRKLHAVYKPKARPLRATKARQLRTEGTELLDSAAPQSKHSETTTASFETVESDCEEQSVENEPYLQEDSSLQGPNTSSQSSVISDRLDSTVDFVSNDGTAPCGDAVESNRYERLDHSHPSTLQPDQSQATREQVYLAFNGEDESDYTQGPARLVLASDGIKECGALLMTLDLSAKIQKAVSARRNFAKARKMNVRKKQVNLNFGSKLNAQIAGHNSRIMRLSNAETPDEDQKQRLEEELSILKRMKEENQVQRQVIQVNLDSRNQTLRMIYENAIEDLEEAFLYAQLVQSPDEAEDAVVEEMDLEKEFQDFRDQLRETDDTLPIHDAPLDTSRDYLYVARDPLTMEQEHEQSLGQDVWTAQERLQAAQVAFDHRNDRRDQELQANVDAVARGEEPQDASPEDFDLRWLKHEQDLTRELIEAEAALAAAKAAAVDANLDVPMDDRASGFVDDVADGYRMSMEQEYMASLPSPKVKNWLSDIPELASPTFNERVEEADDWEADDVGVSDSVSVVAEGAERRRIDKWREVCGI